jgi:hypothetical protein
LDAAAHSCLEDKGTFFEVDLKIFFQRVVINMNDSIVEHQNRLPSNKFYGSATKKVFE